MKCSTVVLFALALGSTLTGETPAPPASPELKFEWADPADPSIAPVRQTGERAIEYAANKFVYEVNQVLSTKTAEEGLDVLHLKNLAMPASYPGGPAVRSIKLTSLQVRDPANTPDNADAAALESIRRDLEDGRSPPKLIVLHIAAGEGTPEEWRLYRPIATVASCLTCHGPVGSLAPGVKEKLQRLFPNDQAVGYTAREWRGLIRVSLAALPPAKP